MRMSVGRAGRGPADEPNKSGVRTRDVRLGPPALNGSRLPAETKRRLVGLACARCGSEHGLRDGGYAQTPTQDGGMLGWPVKVCAHCPERV